MAISRHTGYTTQKVTATSLTFAYDTGSDPDRVLLVVANFDGAAPTITYAGDSMTANTNAGANGGNLIIFEKVDPASGSNNIVVTGGAGSTWLHVVAVSYDGADDAKSLSNATDTDADITGTVTTTADNSYVLAAVVNTGGSSVAWDAGTELADSFSTVGSNRISVDDIQKATAGGQSLTATVTGGTGIDFSGIEITEAAGGGGTANHWLLMGA